MEKIKIIGLTGNIAGGKSVVADLLQKNGYKYFSLSSQVWAIAKKRGLSEPLRSILQDIGNLMRNNFGGDILARLVGAEILTSKEALEKEVLKIVDRLILFVKNIE